MADLKLTEEIKRKLEGSAPYSINGIHNYICKYHKILKEVPENFIPIFQLSVLSREEKQKISNLLKSGLEKATNEELRDLIKPKIKGWKNLYDIGNGEEIKYQADASGIVLDECFSRIPDNLCSDMLFEVIKISGLIDMDRLSLRY